VTRTVSDYNFAANLKTRTKALAQRVFEKSGRAKPPIDMNIIERIKALRQKGDTPKSHNL
jgi:hypothetical protein